MRLVHHLYLAVFASAVLLALPGAALAGDSIKLKRSVGYAEGAFVRPEIRTECNLEDRVPEWIQLYAAKKGIQIQLVDELPQTGLVLQLEIADAIETGNAWTGRQKGLVIQGRLMENGQLKGNFRGRRMTTGGFFGGYKGTCSFLGRCAKTLGSDVAEWLQQPAKGSNIGG